MEINKLESNIQELSLELKTRYKKMMEALWDVLMDANEITVQILDREEKNYQGFLSQLKVKEKIIDLSDSSYNNYLQTRQLNLLTKEIREYQANKSLLNDITELWNKLHYIISSHRTLYRGEYLSENAVRSILSKTRNSDERKKIWQSSMTLGEKVSKGLVDLVKMRNSLANEHGYDNYYQMKMDTEELNISLLNDIIEKIKKDLSPTYKLMKEKIDTEIAMDYGIDRNALQPWHYNQPFFQNHYSSNTPLEVSSNTLLSFISRWFKDRGLDLHTFYSLLDIKEREGKSGANFCLNIDRGFDTRISVNFSSDYTGLNNLLHELGHGFFESQLNPALPFLLRQPSHIFLSEAIAILFEKLALTPHFAEILNFKTDNTFLKVTYNSNLLIKLFWTISVVKFEQQLYSNPDQNLNKLWWNILEEYQGITRPEEWDYPYWAAKAHLTTLPVYYQNYLLGDIASVQIQDTLKSKFGRWYEKDAINHLGSNLLRNGKEKPWYISFSEFTGSTLDTSFLIRRLKEQGI